LVNFTLRQKILVLLVALLAQACIVAGQSYVPVRSYVNYPAELLPGIENHVEKEIAAVASSPYRKELTRLFRARAEELATSIKDSGYYFDTLVYPYYQRIYNTIIKAANTHWDNDLKLLVSRNPVANAYCLGNGVLVYNLALSRQLTSEAQIAFVMCHELGHYLMGHVDSGLMYTLSMTKNADFKRQVAAAKKARYGGNTLLDSLTFSVLCSSSKHSRMQEQQADSLALILLSRTNYDAREAADALLALDSSDFERSHASFSLEQVFNHRDFPFRSEWKASQSSPFFSARQEPDVVRPDTLRTHPDCQVRAQTARTILSDIRYQYAGAVPRQRTEPEALLRATNFELIENLYQNDELAVCLYHTLLLLSTEPGNEYLVATTGAVLNRCRQALADHNLQQLVRRPTPYDKGDFKQLVTFLNNLRLSEIELVNFYFLQQHYQSLRSSEIFLREFVVAAGNAGMKEDAEKALGEMQSEFPTSPYLISLKEHLKQ
jgi:Zn-dependent protease with chaperone function